MRISQAIAALPLVVVLTACGGNSDVTQAESSQSAKSIDDGPSTDDTDEYFKSISNLDQDGLTDDVAQSVPGSPAEAYVKYQSAYVDAVLDFGGSEDQVSGDTFEKVDGGYKTCNEDKCVTWTNIKAQGSKIATFDVNDKPLADIILTGGKRTFDAGNLGSAQLITAYESQQSNTLLVVLKVSSKNDGISLGSYEAKYRSSSGRQSTASAEGTVSGTDLDADSTTTVVLAFPRAELGGKLTLPFNSSDYMTSRSVVVPIAPAK